jgi:guanine deaminase
MDLAVAEALAAVRLNHGGPFGAVIVRNGRVVAGAHNEVVKTNDPTAQAEVTAIRRASAKLKTFDLSTCELYSTCEPCPMCLAAILWARIPRVYYGCTRRDAEKIGFCDNLFYRQMRIGKGAGGVSPGAGGEAKKQLGALSQVPVVKMIQLGRRECLRVFPEWANKKDRVTY